MRFSFLPISRNKNFNCGWSTDFRAKEAAPRARTAPPPPVNALFRPSGQRHAGNVTCKLDGPQRSPSSTIGPCQPCPVRRRGKVELREVYARSVKEEWAAAPAPGKPGFWEGWGEKGRGRDLEAGTSVPLLRHPCAPRPQDSSLGRIRELHLPRRLRGGDSSADGGEGLS